MSAEIDYCDNFKKRVIQHLLNEYAYDVKRNCACFEDHTHDLDLNEWEMEIKYKNNYNKLIRIKIEVEDL